MQTEYYSENRINCHAGNPSPNLEGLVGFPVSFWVTRVTGAGRDLPLTDLKRGSMRCDFFAVVMLGASP